MIAFVSCKKVEHRLVIELEKDGKQVLAILSPQVVGAPFINDPAGPRELVKTLVAALNEADVVPVQAEPEPVEVNVLVPGDAPNTVKMINRTKAKVAK